MLVFENIKDEATPFSAGYYYFSVSTLYSQRRHKLFQLSSEFISSTTLVKIWLLVYFFI